MISYCTCLLLIPFRCRFEFGKSVGHRNYRKFEKLQHVQMCKKYSLFSSCTVKVNLVDHGIDKQLFWMSIFQPNGLPSIRIQSSKRQSVKTHWCQVKPFSARPLKFVFAGYFINKSDAKLVEVAEAACLGLHDLNAMLVTCLPSFPCFQRNLGQNEIENISSDAFAGLNYLTLL